MPKIQKGQGPWAVRSATPAFRSMTCTATPKRQRWKRCRAPDFLRTGSRRQSETARAGQDPQSASRRRHSRRCALGAFGSVTDPSAAYHGFPCCTFTETRNPALLVWFASRTALSIALLRSSRRPVHCPGRGPLVPSTLASKEVSFNQ
jgi:hypothetical protein